MESVKQSTQLESVKQATQRQFTQLRTWFHGNDATLQKLLNQLQTANPEKDQYWCINQLWSEQRTWRY
ncbi:hypothetical protein IQ266_01445 [filamentous cyanobacterium LEGE 11480]|uniref:Uncharacterized protein n=1 Tax=Romeriopsis navalis LEGE 11480 TaxID=2777977 RepID=A0A928VIK4_9CYAN|nr:hypothetical protein [Romeriopsis navalis]MBE9028418.1 hypothetical protein [Romeriopsis navalis LEGE 11480]